MPAHFVWTTGRTLDDCLPSPTLFDYVVSSHVLEHVPDFLGALYQMRAVLQDDGVIAFALPDVRGSGEYFRRTSTAAEIVGAYLRAETKPTPAQVYDGFRNYFPFHNVPLAGKTLDDVARDFTDADSLAIAERAVTSYIDVHCWAFSRSTFAELCAELTRIGLFDFAIEALDASVPTATGHGAEFYVKLRPTAPARAIRQLPDEQAAALAHSHRAFAEALAAQDRLKLEKAAAEAEVAQLAAAKADLLAACARLTAAVEHGEQAFHEAVAAQDLLKAQKQAAEADLARCREEVAALQASLVDVNAARAGHHRPAVDHEPVPRPGRAALWTWLRAAAGRSGAPSWHPGPGATGS